MKHKTHHYKETHIEHFKDGSHAVHHKHEEEGPHKDYKHAAADLDDVHDSLQDHLGEMNPGEAEANAGDHGIPMEHAGPAGIPAPIPMPPEGQ